MSMFSIYVILTTHFSHFYLIWDFTYTCNPTIFPSHVSLPLYGLQDLFVGHEQVLLTSPCLMGFALHQRVIHGSLIRHPWEPRVNPACQCPWETRITPLFSTISNIHLLGFFFSSPRSLCVGRLGFSVPAG